MRHIHTLAGVLFYKEPWLRAYAEVIIQLGRRRALGDIKLRDLYRPGLLLSQDTDAQCF